MKISFVSLGNPLDRSVWSGTPFYSLREIQRRYPDVEVFNPAGFDRVLQRANSLTRKVGLDLGREMAVTRAYGRLLTAHTRRYQPDVIVSIGASNKFAYLEEPVPVVHVSDALFGTIVDYYSRYNRFAPRTRALGNEVQRLAAAKCSTIALTSDWARQSAIDLYGLDPDQVVVAPIGANLEKDPGRAALAQEKSDLRLVFIGIDWERKGGRQMLEVFKALRELRPDARLDIVGCEPPEAEHVEGVTVWGYLRKSVPEQREKLEDLLEQAAFFMMLSPEEAFGLVYCEAAAYGLPAIGLKTGGVTTIVQDGKTGILFDTGASAQEVARGIQAIWEDRPGYDAMRAAARSRYETLLNWTAWGDTMGAAIERAAALPKRKKVGSEELAPNALSDGHRLPVE